LPQKEFKRRVKPSASLLQDAEKEYFRIERESPNTMLAPTALTPRPTA
jgi:hypothetical protein